MVVGHRLPTRIKLPYRFLSMVCDLISRYLYSTEAAKARQSMSLGTRRMTMDSIALFWITGPLKSIVASLAVVELMA